MEAVWDRKYYERVFYDLISHQYSDLRRKDIFVGIGFEDRDFLQTFGGRYSLQVYRPDFFSSRYVIDGTLQNELLTLPNYPLLINALLAHELSHIVLEDIDFNLENLLAISLGLFSQDKVSRGPFKFPRSIVSRIEKRADRDAVRRGLGKEIYEYARHYEELCRRNGMTVSGLYLSSSEVKRLIERN